MAPLEMPREYISRATLEPLDQYCATFGVSLSQLDVSQVAMFLVGRNLSPLLAQLRETPLARAHTSSHQEILQQLRLSALPSEERTATETLTTVPSDNQDVAPVEGPDDFPNLTMPHRALSLLEDAELLFDKKFLCGELEKRVYRHDDIERGERARSSVDEARSADDGRTQRGVVALDISGTMNNRESRGLREFDGVLTRGVVSKGLALEFLRRTALREGALHVAAFREKITNAFTGNGTHDLTHIAVNVVSLKNHGITKIETALQEICTDVLSRRTFLHDDILLVTDALSDIRKWPTSMKRLHSFVIGDLSIEEKEKYLGALSSRSSTFCHLQNEDLKVLLHLTKQDIEAIQHRVPEMYTRSQAPEEKDPEVFARDVENAYALVAMGRTDMELKEVAEKLKETLRVLRKAVRHHQQEQAEARAVSSERDLNAEVSLRIFGSGKGGDPRLFFLVLQEAVRRYIRKIREFVSRL
jgi:hypothetical protein